MDRRLPRLKQRNMFKRKVPKFEEVGEEISQVKRETPMVEKETNQAPQGPRV